MRKPFFEETQLKTEVEPTENKNERLRRPASLPLFT